MSPQLKLQPAKLATTSCDRTACLLFLDGDLSAVLVRLDEEAHGHERGSWFLEIGFGPCEVTPPPLFATMDAAQTWVLARHEQTKPPALTAV